MATFREAQRSIMARVKALGAEQMFDVFEVALPVGYELEEQFGQHSPYVLVSFGGKSPVAEPLQGISGTRDNLKWTSVAVEIIANSPETVNDIADIVRDNLEGYVADPAWGELIERLSGDYSVRAPDFDLWPVRFATGIVFNTNADN